MTFEAELPEYIDPEAWSGWIEARKKIKKPPTERALKLALKKLEKLREEGEDPNAVLDQSTLNSWQDLFPVRSATRAPAQQMDTAGPWQQFRSAIRDGRAPADPVIASILTQFGGLHRLGEQSSWSLDQRRKDFDAAYRSAKSH